MLHVNRCAVSALLAAATILAVAPAASAEIVLTDSSNSDTKATTSTDPMVSEVFGSSGFSLGSAGGSSTDSGQKGLCTVIGSASALSGMAALGCGGVSPGTVGPIIH